MTNRSTQGDKDWRDKAGTQCEQFCHMLRNNIRTDCTFVVGSGKQERFQCHKLQLCRASPVFDLMLYGPGSEEGEISLANVQPETFRELIKYIYTEQVDLKSAGGALSLCRAACFYKMTRLREACLLFLGDNLGEDCLWPSLEFSLQGDETLPLREKCLQYLRDHTLLCLKQKDFEGASRACLMLLLQQDSLNIDSELSLIRAAHRWAKAEAGRLYGPKCRGMERSALGPSFPLLRFLSLSPEQFSTNLSDTNLLTDQEKLSILVNLNVPGKMVLPTEICTKKESRQRTVQKLSVTSKNNQEKTIVLKPDINKTQNDLNNLIKKKSQSSSQRDNNNSYKNYLPDNYLAGPSLNHFVCTRTILDSSEELYLFCKSPLISEIEFTVNANIKVIGLEVSTQHIKDTRTLTYREDIIITIKNSKGWFYESYYKADAYYNARQFIGFNEPVSLCKNNLYFITVHYNVEEGRYLTPKRDTDVNARGVLFRFNPYSKASENIQSIVFC